MEPDKVSDGVRDILEFLKGGKISMAEQIVILRSTADLLSQIIVSEAAGAMLVASFKNVTNIKS